MTVDAATIGLSNAQFDEIRKVRDFISSQYSTLDLRADAAERKKLWDAYKEIMDAWNAICARKLRATNEEMEELIGDLRGEVQNIKNRLDELERVGDTIAIVGRVAGIFTKILSL